MKRIKFTLDTVFETFGPNHPDNPRFAAEQVEDMRDDQAERWLKRGRAELVEDLGPDEQTFEGVDPLVVDEIKQSVAAEIKDEVREKLKDEVAGEVDADIEALNSATDRLAGAVSTP